MTKHTAPRMSKSKKFLFMFLILAVLCMILAITMIYMLINTKKEITVPISAVPIRQGSLITPDKIKETPISRIGLTENMIKDPAAVLNKFAIRNFAPNEYFFYSSLTDNYAKTAQEKAIFGAMAITINNIQSANNEIKENDFVRIYVIMKKDKSQLNESITSVNGKTFPEPPAQIYYTPELAAVRVLGVYDSDQKTVEVAKNNILWAEKEGQEALKNAEKSAPSLILLDLLPIQQAMLLQAQYGGSIHIVVPPKSVQDRFRQIWGLMDAEGKEVVEETKPISEKAQKELETKHTKLQEEIEKKEGDSINVKIQEQNKMLKGEVTNINESGLEEKTKTKK